MGCLGAYGGVWGCACGVTKLQATYLAGGINDLGRKLLVLVPYDLAKRILDGWIIALDEVTVDELNRQAGFACTSWSVGGAPAFTRERRRRLRLELAGSTHRQLYCRQWQSSVAWAPASCCWLCGGIVKQRSGSPALKLVVGTMVRC